MPVKVQKRGDEWCVIDPDGSVVKGGCHDVEQEAQDHAAAINANTQKAVPTAKELDLEALAGSEGGVLNRVKNAVKKAAGVETKKTGLLIYKGSGGVNRFVARYSNNFRDNDNPPEIISAQSHKAFCALVDVGLVPPPELWIWHEKALRLGQSEWVAYDDSGFPLAGGYFYEGTEDLVAALKQLDNVAMSHGMPKWSIRRDEKDNSIITQHITEEISLLPGWAAANKRTGFVILDESIEKQEDNMAISQEKRAELLEKWNIGADLLDALERQNSKDAASAAEAGVESKETKEEEAIDSVAEPEAEAQVEPEEADAEDETSTEAEAANVQLEGLEEFAHVLEETMKGVIAISERVKGLEAQVKELAQSDAEKISRKKEATPLASMAELLSLSVIGKEETRVDGRTSLGRDAPKETEPEVEKRTGIPWIDTMLASNGAGRKN